jgi:hypothetical protein
MIRLIAIAREYGSGVAYIARKLAKRLHANALIISFAAMPAQDPVRHIFWT